MVTNKYRAKRIILDGIKFPSQKEGKRYADLKMLERAGKISALKLQEPFEISINGKKCFTYRADFFYIENGQHVVEDCKGFRTPVYRLKKKCVEAAYNIRILET